MTVHDFIHVLLYGMSGYGKSTMAATFPKPMLVFAFDLWDKTKPYKRLGTSTRLTSANAATEGAKLSAAWYEGMQVPVTDVRGPDGSLICRIEHYYDANPLKPTAFSRFTQRMVVFDDNPQRYEEFKTICLDSLTFYKNAAIQWERMVNNPGKSNSLRWFGDGKLHIENLVYSRLGMANTNVIVLAHEATKTSEFGSSGDQRGVSAVGTLQAELPAAFGETYHLVVERDMDGNLERKVRTQVHEVDGNTWFAASQEGLKDGCEPTYEALWGGKEEVS